MRILPVDLANISIGSGYVRNNLTVAGDLIVQGTSNIGANFEAVIGDFTMGSATVDAGNFGMMKGGSWSVLFNNSSQVFSFYGTSDDGLRVYGGDTSKYGLIYHDGTDLHITAMPDVAGSSGGGDIYIHPPDGDVYLNTNLHVQSGNASVLTNGRANFNYDPSDVNSPAFWLSSSNSTPGSGLDYILVNPDEGATSPVSFDYFLRFRHSGSDLFTIDDLGVMRLTGANSQANAVEIGDGTNAIRLAAVDGIATLYGGAGATKYLRIGDASTSAHGLASEDDLLVTGSLEVTGSLLLSGVTTAYDNIKLRDNQNLALGNGSDARLDWSTGNVNNAMVISILTNGTSSGSGNIIVTTSTYRDRDYGHPVNNDTTIYIQSATDPLTDDTQWLSLTHNKTDGVITTGTGALKLVSGAADGGIAQILETTNAFTIGGKLQVWRNLTTDKAWVGYEGQVNASNDGIVTKVKAGTISDADFAEDTDGLLAIDSTDGRIYFRYGATWHYINQTAGFEINAEDTNCAVCGRPMRVGQVVTGILDSRKSDGALHGEYAHIGCALKKEMKIAA